MTEQASITRDNLENSMAKIDFNNLRLDIQKVAILGAGVMGAQIAAHFVNAGYNVILFDLAGSESNKNLLINDAITGLLNLKPAPLVNAKWSRYITPANYDDNLDMLADCDLVIEAIAERADWKADLFKKILPHLGEKTILASNTSGLSVNALAEALPRSVRSRFCGIHFFNPPRYLPLVELVPHERTDERLLDALETFLTTRVGKNIVRAKDTPNFIGNRIGVFALLIALHYAEKYDLRLDVVDVLTGPLIGHPKSATLRTLDIVGLDTFAHVVNTMANDLKEDPWRDAFQVPEWMSKLIDKNMLGQKTRGGVYRKDAEGLHVFDIKDHSYRPVTGQAHKDVLDILKIKDLGERFKRLRESKRPEAKFLWEYHCDLWHYAAFHLDDIAETVRDVDQAMRWGFAWKQGPFELWHQSGWRAITDAVSEDISAGRTLCSLALPHWTLALGDKGCYQPEGAYSPIVERYLARRQLPVYQRQLFPTPMPEEHFDEGDTLYEDEFVRLWQQSDPVGILSFKSKMATIGTGVLAGIQSALDVAVKQCDALVIWQRHCPHFSVGANIQEFMDSIHAKDFAAINNTLDNFQQACLALRRAPIPVVGALRGYVLGGGCELALHCDKRVAHLETYMGLVEAGVGLLPAGGGCKEMALRAYEKSADGDPMPFLKQYFENIAMAKASSSAFEAKKLGYLTPDDQIIMHADELLYTAKQMALALSQCDYQPLRPDLIRVVGDTGWAQFETLLVNMLEGRSISQHDYLIAHHIAKILSGGIVNANSEVDETWLLRLEREGFIELASTPETLARIEHMLKTGKPLRN